MSENEFIFCDRVRAGQFRVDDVGQIWRKTRNGECRAERRTPLGYLQVRFVHEGRRLHLGAHRCVWAWFRGFIARDMVVNHLNGRKDDNRVANLELTTPSGNTKHAHATGLRDQRGERNPAAKLTDAHVAQIRVDYALGNVTQRELGRRFGVSDKTISKIILRQRRTGARA